MLGRDAGDGKTTRIFTREHAEELHDSAAKEEASLRGATTQPGLRTTLRRLATLAGTTTRVLGRLGDAPESEQQRLGARLDATAKRIERIVQRL
jgi:hypothetical protein